MSYTGISQIFEHTHKCEREGQQVAVRPDCEDGTFYRRVPVCIETGTELELKHEDKFPLPVPSDDER